jgi:crotonobetainyl-CoA:carnitine CoA-transferase CaiB-like acyl-CoA transferase
MTEATLAGVRVAAFTHFAAGPIAAQYLGALGADVIKVEAPQRDVNRYAVRDPGGRLQGISPYFVVTNRNQRCLGLDLKSTGGIEAARTLVARSDVLIENYRPGVMDRLGLGYETAKALNPRIVYLSLSAHDPEGPARDAPGQDLLIQALSGLASLTGRGDAPPVPVGAYLIDGVTALQGVIGVLAALRHRDRHGEGQRVRCDMMSAAVYMMAQEASWAMNVGPIERSRAGIAHANQAAPYGIYETADGAVAVSTFGGVSMLRRIAEALDLVADLETHLSEQGARDHRDVIASAIGARLRRLTSEAAIAAIAPTGAWVVRVRSLGEALDDPAVVATGIIRDVETPYGGKYRVVIEPLKLSQSPLIFSRPAPNLGEHTQGVLSELGYSQAEVNALMAAGAAFAVPAAATAHDSVPSVTDVG